MFGPACSHVKHPEVCIPKAQLQEEKDKRAAEQRLKAPLKIDAEIKLASIFWFGLMSKKNGPRMDCFQKAVLENIPGHQISVTQTRDRNAQSRRFKSWRRRVARRRQTPDTGAGPVSESLDKKSQYL